MEEISILAFGDFRAACCENIKFSDSLSCLLKQADVKICNFEAPIKSDGPVTKKCGPKIDQSEKSPDFLIDNGFNVVLLSNNHMMDHDSIGCEKTKEAFNRIIAVGAGRAKEAYKVRSHRIKNKTIGYLSLCQHEFGIVESRDEEGFGVAWTGSLDIQEIINEAKKSVDFLFVFPHAGVEQSFAPLPHWRKLYKKYIDWGADGVIASHPHTPQGWEYYKNKPILYSLGNFYFDELSGDEYWNKGLMANMIINDTGIKVSVKNIGFDTSGFISIDENDEIKQHTDYLNELLVSEKGYNDYIEQLCRKLYDGHKYGVLRGFAGTTLHIKKSYALRLTGLMFMNKKDTSTALNRFQCESHRWVIEYCLKKGF